MTRLEENGQTFIIFEDGEPCMKKTCSVHKLTPCDRCQRTACQGVAKFKVEVRELSRKPTFLSDYQPSNPMSELEKLGIQ